MAEVDWDDKVLIENYPECSPVGPSLEEIYKAFIERYKREKRDKENQADRSLSDAEEVERWVRRYQQS